MSDQRNTNYWLFFWPTAITVSLFSLNLMLNGWPDWSDWLDKLAKHEKATAALRNIGLIFLGIIGLGLAIWRTKTASDQRDIANKQAQTSIDQIRIAQQGQFADRYAKAAAMLSESELSVREAGIFALRELGFADPRGHYFPVQSLLCSFIRDRSKSMRGDTGSPPLVKDYGKDHNQCEGDVKEALRAFIDLRTSENKAREKSKMWTPDLSGAYFAQLDLSLVDIDLSGVNLQGANFIDAQLFRADFSYSNFSDANFRGADLDLAEFKGADLFRTDFSKASFLSTVFTRASLDEVNFGSANLEGAQLNDAELVEVDFRDARLKDADFSRAHVSNVNLSEADLTDAIWAGAIIRNTDFSEAITDGIDWSEVSIASEDIPKP
ncbi:pentapeptide repeat-containing protein [Cohaesibacter gelatinilyticus]|uniref:Uncharacterized protein YjbI, contains pentapeptide repeats n=1 Tax=Cohaesibacter gelatinilyticus TaxID=372072 RepID=A0A285PGV2_9HYPH|nr:pentapeptide repeat-containing protein [Cohaesibacter gelatinilyticus]SNZ20934.1 Uncharacterized protein YjbI, contains pentapeptide repeats [Cohaesibacter gelatinilyticus]